MPIIDGKFVPMEPAEAFKSGKFNRVTLINGNTLDEGTFFAGLQENMSGVVLDENGYAKAVESFFGKELAPKILKDYPASAYTTPSDAYSAALTSSVFACTVQAINRWVSDKTPTYAYEFADRTAPSYLGPTTFALGAAHTYEIPYLFPGFHGGSTLSVKLNPLQEKLSDKMVTDWSQASLAGQREPEWPRYDPAKQNVFSLVLPAPRMTEGRFATVHHREFWDRLGLY